MILQGFVGPAYTLDSLNVDAQRCINLFPELVESGDGKEGQRYYLKSTPGLKNILSVGNGPIRCLHTDSLGRIFVVSGNQLFRIARDTQSSLIATNYTAISLDQATYVSASTDTITKASHGFFTGLKVQVSSSGTLPSGLSASTDYWVIVINTDTIQLATSLSNAINATQIDITNAQTGTLTITPQIAPIVTRTFSQSGNVDLSTDLVLPGGSSTSPSGFSTGQQVQVSSDVLPTGLLASTNYYVIRVDANTFKLATTASNASAGTAIDITNAKTGTMTITPTSSHVYAVSSTAVDTSADTINLNTPQNALLLQYLFTGLKIQISTTVTLPGGLSAATDYWVISDGSPFIKLASTLANAVAGTQINITTQGSGTHTLTATSVTNSSVTQATAVNAATDQITDTSHGFYSGLQVQVSGGSLPTGLLTGTNYWVYAPDAYSVGFATSANNALAGVLVDLSVAGSQNMTVTAQAASALSGILQSNISSSTDTITYTSHGLYTGLKVQFTTLCTTSGGLDFLTDYYIIKVDANSFKLATSVSNASSGTAIDITTYSGSWTKTLVGSNGLDGGAAETFNGSTGTIKAASMSYLGNGTESSTLFVDGVKSYWFQDNGASTNFGPLTGYGFSDVTNPSAIDWIDGYFIVNQSGTNKFFVSDLQSPNFDGLSFASAEGSPDALFSVIANERNLVLLGERSTEVFVDTGNADFPFERVQGGFTETGIVAQFSADKIDGTVFWLGRSDEGQGVVYAASGLQPQRISTHAIEQAISGYADITTAVAFTYQMNGHRFYVLNFDEATWVYDLSTGFWHQRSYTNSGALERHRAQYHSFAPNENLHLIGDYENSNIFQFDEATYTDNLTTITRLRTSPHLSNDLNRVFYHKFQLDMEVGIGLAVGQGSDPTVMLDFSNDGGHTWSSQSFALADAGGGQIGEYKTRVIWRRLGQARDRIFRVQITDPVKVVLLAAHIDVTAGSS